MHWSQAVNRADSRHLVALDFGTDCENGPVPNACNQRAYGSRAPRVYNLSAITTPLALFSGDRDVLSTPLDVEVLLEELTSVIFARTYKGYSHLDFTWFGSATRQEVNRDVLHLLRAASASAV